MMTRTLSLLALLLLWPCAAQAKGLDFTAQRGHKAGVQTVAFSPDGLLALSGDKDRTAILWDMRTGRTVRVFEEEARFTALAFHPTRPDTAFFGLDNGVVKVTDLTGTAPSRPLSSAEGYMGSMALSPKGDLVAMGFKDKVVLRDTGTGKITRTLKVPGLPRVAFSPDGRSLAVGGTGRASIWDLSTGKRLHQTGFGYGVVFVLAFSPKGDRLTLISSGGHARVWHLSGKVRLDELALPILQNSAQGISPDGRWFINSRLNGDTVVIDLHTGKEAFRVKAPSYPRAITFSRDSAQALIGGNRSVQALDLTHGRLRHTLEGRRVDGFQGAFSQDGRWLSTTDGTQAIVWDLGLLKPAARLRFDKTRIAHTAFTPDGKTLLIAGGVTARGGVLHVIDTDTWQTRHTLRGHGYTTTTAVASHDSKLAFTGTHIGGEALVWDLVAGRALIEKPASIGGDVWSASFSRDAGSIFISNGGKQLVEWQWRTGTHKALFRSDRRTVPSNPRMAHDAEGRFAAIAGVKTGFWDARSGKRLHLMPDPSGEQVYASGITITPDDNHFALSQGQSVFFIHKKTHQIVRRFDGVGQLMAISPDQRFIVTRRWPDNLPVLRKVGTKQRLTLIAEGDQWLTFTPEGLFDASPGGAALVSMVQGTRLFNIDQLALANNRPDLILKNLGLGDPRLRDHYRAVHLRRLARVGIKDASALSGNLSLPTIEMKTLGPPTRDGRVKISLDMQDARGLRQLQIYAGGVPLLPKGGQRISGTRHSALHTVTLVPGLNRLEASVTNTRGQESLRALTQVHHAQAQRGDLYVLAFGVSRYKDPALDIRFADKDAQDLASLLSKHQGVAFDKVHTRVYTNERATLANLRAARSFITGANPRDTFVLFIAGHGLHDSDEAGTYYFLTHEADTRRLSTTAASFDTLESLLIDIPPRRKLVLMDTCESGEFEASRGGAALELAQSRGLIARSMRGFKQDDTHTLAPLKDHAARPYLTQRDRFLYVDLLRRTGAVIFSSSRGGEFSYESPRLKQGFFTHALLQALSSKDADTNADGQLSINELRRTVTARVSTLTHNLQNPTIDRDNIHQDIALPLAGYR